MQTQHSITDVHIYVRCRFVALCKQPSTHTTNNLGNRQHKNICSTHGQDNVRVDALLKGNTLGFNRKTSYGIGKRQDIANALLGEKMNPILHSTVSVKMVDQILFLLGGVSADAAVSNFKRVGIKTHGGLKDALLANFELSGKGYWDLLAADLSNLNDLCRHRTPTPGTRCGKRSTR